MISSQSKYILLFFLLISGVLTAQGVRFNQLSVELTTGIHVPLSPRGIARSHYIAFRQFQVAGRYMFSEKYGVKGHYAFNSFKNSKNSDQGVSLNRFGLEGVVNLGQAFNVDYSIREKVNLLFHAGLGLTFASSSSVSGVDNVGNLLVGLTGEIKLNNRFTLLGDMTYVANFSQDLGYNGARIDTSSGGFVNVSVGIMYSLGYRNHHADWY